MSSVRRILVLSLASTAAGCVEGGAAPPPESPGTYGPPIGAGVSNAPAAPPPFASPPEIADMPLAGNRSIVGS
jgi:hypothetical protein